MTYIEQLNRNVRYFNDQFEQLILEVNKKWDLNLQLIQSDKTVKYRLVLPTIEKIFSVCQEINLISINHKKSFHTFIKEVSSQRYRKLISFTITKKEIPYILRINELLHSALTVLSIIKDLFTNTDKYYAVISIDANENKVNEYRITFKSLIENKVEELVLSCNKKPQKCSFCKGLILDEDINRIGYFGGHCRCSQGGLFYEKSNIISDSSGISKIKDYNNYVLTKYDQDHFS